MKLSFATVLAAGVLTLAACTSTTPPAPSTKPSATPQPTDLASPPNANWQNLGVTPNGNILNEIDLMSIKRKDSLVSFRDRKTIFNPQRENFGTTPPHKTAISSWVIDCKAATFRLTTMSLYDNNGRLIQDYTFNARDIKPSAVLPNSASDQQMQVVCKNLEKPS